MFPRPSAMSFSATILFSPPGGSEARCCCCACKSETSASSAGSQGGNPPASTPITVTGHGLAVQSSEQLLHIIYQRVEKAVGLAEAALGLARANNELLKRLQEEVGELRQGKASAPDEDGASRAHGSPPPEPGPLKESPGEACKAAAAVEEECDSMGSGMQVVIEELWQVGAASAVGPGPLGFPAAQRDARLPGCALTAGDAAPLLNPVSMAAERAAVARVAPGGFSWPVPLPSPSLWFLPSLQPCFWCSCADTGQHEASWQGRAALACFPPKPRWPECVSGARGAGRALPWLSGTRVPPPPAQLAPLLPGLCLSWRGGLPRTDGSFIFYHGPSACQEEFSTDREMGMGRGEAEVQREGEPERDRGRDRERTKGTERQV